jgi:hypothetical protein
MGVSANSSGGNTIAPSGVRTVVANIGMLRVNACATASGRKLRALTGCGELTCTSLRFQTRTVNVPLRIITRTTGASPAGKTIGEV